MDALTTLKLSLCVLLLTKTCDANTYSSAKCSPQSPEIRYPFGLHPHQCGLPHLNLFCKHNTTIIHFPHYGDLVVKSISYDAKRLNLLDPKNCVHGVFLNLNLSLTPFSYYYTVRKYKYINCSSELVGSFEQVPCLSGSNHHVYVVEPSFVVPVSCNSLKTVVIPFSYSPYLSDSSFGLGFTWSSTRLYAEEEGILSCKLRILCGILHLLKYLMVTGIIAFVFVVGKLLYASLSKKYCNRNNVEKVKRQLEEEEEIDELLGEYEDLNALKF